MKRRKYLIGFVVLAISVSLSSCSLKKEAGNTNESELTEESKVNRFKYNPYAMIKEQRDFMGDYYDDYKKLVDALLNGESELIIDTQEGFNKASRGIYASFIPKVLIQDMKYDSNTKKVQIIYNDPQEVYKKKVDEYVAKVEEILNDNISEGDNELTKALKLYKYVSQHISYSSDIFHNDYTALMDGVGLCQEYSNLYTFLLRQVGIECTEASGPMDNGTYHAWAIVKIEGTNYHMDPTFESTDPSSNGKGLKYFGMSDEERLSTGVLPSYLAPTIDWFKVMDKRICPDNKFEVLRNTDNWEFDYESGKILLFNNGQSIGEYDF